MSEYDGFRVEHDAERGVATITLDVPGKFNRVSMLARDQLAELFAELDRDDAVRFVVLTGAGGQFTAGGDIAGFLTRSPWVVSQLAKNVAAPERCSKPVIAQARGLRVRRRARARARVRLPDRRRRPADGAARGDDRDDPRLRAARSGSPGSSGSAARRTSSCAAAG